MKLRELEVLNAILQTGSVTAAARLLNVSQPSVSTVLQHSEARLGMQLFVRSGGRLKASPEAMALLPEIREIFRRVDRVSRSAQSLARGRLGRISIAGTHAFASGYLVDAVAAFRVTHPDVEVAIHTLQAQEMAERVLANEINLGICHGPVSNPALLVEELASGPLVCVLPAEHRLAAQASITPQDLQDERLITYVDGDWLRGRVDDLFDQIDRKPDLSLQVGQTSVALRLVAAGLGLALVEPFHIAAIRPPGLVARPVKPTVALGVELIRPQGIVESAAVAAFVATLRGLTRGLSGILGPQKGTRIGPHTPAPAIDDLAMGS